MRFWPERGQLWDCSLAALAEGASLAPWLLLVRAWAGPSGAMALWGAPALRAVVEAGPAAAAWLMAAIFLAGALWERLGGAFWAGGRWWSVLGVLLLLGGAACALPWWMLPAAAYLWYQGARQNAGGLSYAEVSGRLGRLGLFQAAAVLLMYASGTARAAALEGALVGMVLLLYGSGLGLVARARERAVRPTNEKPAAGSSRSLTILALLAVALAGLQAAHLLSPGSALGGLWGGLAALLGYLAYPFALLLEYVLMPLFRRIAASEQWDEFLGEPPAQPDPAALPSGEPLLTPEMLARLGAVLLAAGTLAALAAAIVRLRPGKRGKEAAPDEERISLGFWQSLWRDLRELRMLGRKADALAKNGSSGDEDGPVTPGSPRWLYRRLQEWGNEVGRCRRPGETPAAYAEALSAHRPEAAAAARQVTAVYMEARYSPSPPAGEAVEDAQRALHAFQTSSEAPIMVLLAPLHGNSTERREGV